MVHFQRLGQNASAAIGLKERTSFFDTALLQALFWSLIIHLVLFGTFRIRLNDYQETSQEMIPLNVAIDDEPIAQAGVQESEDFDSSLICFNFDDHESKRKNLGNLRLPSS